MSILPSNTGMSADGLSAISPGPLTGHGYPAGVPRTVDIPAMAAWGLLARATESVPERLAVEFLNHRWSYRQVDEASTRLAGWLREQAIDVGDRVGVLLPNSAEYLIALNGIWKAGGVAVAISPLSVPNDVEALLKLTDCRTVICLDVLYPLLKQCEALDHVLMTSLYQYLPAWTRIGYLATRWHRTGRLLYGTDASHHWFWEAIHQGSPEFTAENCHPLFPAYILSTGGTTGDPKAVTLSHRNIVANAWQQMHWAGATMGQETLFAVLPFFHSYGMSTMLAGGPALGASLIMQPRFHPLRALKGIESHRPTVFHAVPAMLAAMNEVLRKQSVDLSSLKWVISGGAALPASIAEEFARYSGAIVVEGYGLSEASPVTHVGPLDGTNIQGTIGLHLPNTECRIVDQSDGKTELADEQVGELIVRGPQVMLGYWNNPTATASAIRDGWLYTGDLAVRHGNGFYRIVDRKKDLIITAGFNVYPGDVEEILRQHPDIRDVAVVGVPDAERGETVKAFIVLRPGVTWQLSRLQAFARERLAAHRRPRLWENVSELPRNFLGKVLRRELREKSSMDR
jgi:long-chain acyl-CoA synthetase